MQHSLSQIKDDDLKIEILELARKAYSRLTNIEGNSNLFAADISGLEKRVEKGLEYLKEESGKIDKKITSHNKTYKQ